MVWAWISWKGKTEQVVVNGNLNAIDYVHLHEDYYLPFNEELYGGKTILERDNAPAHSAKHTRDFFASEGIIYMVWPPRSSDLNCIENAWCELSLRLYAGARQFESVEDFCEALYYEWDNLELDYVRKLVLSMPDRVEACRTSRGRATKY